jgi:hypothetical protein
MNDLIKQVSRHWHFMRFIRLLLGVYIIVQAIADRNLLVGLLGVAFSSMAILNAGCCGSSSCTPTKKIPDNTKEFTYEEVV